MKAIWKVEKIPILKDNFIFVFYNDEQAWVVDPGDSSPVLKFLYKKSLKCAGILLTHHHWDHIDGVSGILEKYPCSVYAPFKNKSQISTATHFLTDGERLKISGLEVEVWELPGHTLGHIAFWVPAEQWLFSGDVLFALGCGRLFEGSFEQMFKSLQRIKALPDSSAIYCTHDYFSINSRFCLNLKIDLKNYLSVHPLLLGQEKKFNPFLTAESVDEFRMIREKRNSI